MSDQKTIEDILQSLSPEALELAKRVLALERENLHIKNPTMLVPKIMEAAKELAR